MVTRCGLGCDRRNGRCRGDREDMGSPHPSGGGSDNEKVRRERELKAERQSESQCRGCPGMSVPGARGFLLTRLQATEARCTCSRLCPVIKQEPVTGVTL